MLLMSFYSQVVQWNNIVVRICFSVAITWIHIFLLLVMQLTYIRIPLSFFGVQWCHFILVSETVALISWTIAMAKNIWTPSFALSSAQKLLLTIFDYSNWWGSSDRHDCQWHNKCLMLLQIFAILAWIIKFSLRFPLASTDFPFCICSLLLLPLVVFVLRKCR